MLHYAHGHCLDLIIFTVIINYVRKCFKHKESAFMPEIPGKIESKFYPQKKPL